MLYFNNRGYLTPGGNIVSSLAEIKETFLITETRERLFEKYLSYSNSLKAACQLPYAQWLDGSFCTLKKEPGDIDVVSFIPYAIINRDEQLFSQFSYPRSESEHGVDAYIVKIYPGNEKHYSRYISDKLYWQEHFSRTKRNRAGNKYAKGFLEIIF